MFEPKLIQCKSVIQFRNVNKVMRVCREFTKWPPFCLLFYFWTIPSRLFKKAVCLLGFLSGVSLALSPHQNICLRKLLEFFPKSGPLNFFRTLPTGRTLQLLHNRIRSRLGQSAECPL